MTILVSVEKNKLPGYKFTARSTKTSLRRHMRASLSLLGAALSTGLQNRTMRRSISTVDDFRYLEGTVHHDNVDGLVYETARVVDEVFTRCGTFTVANRKLIYPNGARGTEDKKAINIYAIEKRTTCTVEEILD